ncbi:hypothetical protein MA16_Dca013757 [Dendrobium catenatum]|uniref:Uncharacterized protein n=1 Tax=Dendrobium catenatum TaxID=906689 RepID=A0A2I0VWE9_9ASPA|nr:hypothetical protein MA16_Dca013757 [Dendrobium catenatum]
MANARLRDTCFLNGSSAPLSFKDALSGVSSSSFHDLCVSSYRGLSALFISEEEIRSLATPFKFSLVGRFPVDNAVPGGDVGTPDVASTVLSLDALPFVPPILELGSPAPNCSAIVPVMSLNGLCTAHEDVAETPSVNLCENIEVGVLPIVVSPRASHSAVNNLGCVVNVAPLFSVSDFSKTPEVVVGPIGSVSDSDILGVLYATNKALGQQHFSQLICAGSYLRQTKHSGSGITAGIRQLHRRRQATIRRAVAMRQNGDTTFVPPPDEEDDKPAASTATGGGRRWEEAAEDEQNKMI